MVDSLFLIEPVKLAESTAGSLLTLEGDEGFHAVSVQRMKVGNSLLLADGEGKLAHCEVEAIEGKSTLHARVIALTITPPPQPRVVVVQALAKGERGELAVELLTEVGVDVIVPWAATRCIVKWDGEKADKGVKKWRTTAREASKQARRATIPQVTNLAHTNDVSRLISETSHAYVLHETGQLKLSSASIPLQGDVLLVVGPEGGLTDQELEEFTLKGGTIARLGPTILRTSTAGTVAAGIVMSRTNRWL